MTIEREKLKALALAVQSGAEPDPFGAVFEYENATKPEKILALLAEIERLEGCEEVLRQLASYVGSGGYNAPDVDPEVFAKKILDGINILNDPLAQLAEKRAEERDQLKAENEALRKERVPAGIYRELVALRELRDQAKSYVDGYLQDEVEDADSRISEEQHLSAAALSESLMDAFEAHWDAAMAKEVFHG